MRHHKTHHQVGLGNHFLNRATLIFLILITITLGTLGSAIYADYKVGFFKAKVVEPLQKFFSEVGKSLEESPTPDLTDIELIATSSGSINVNIQTDGNIKEKYYTPSKTNYNYEFKYLTPAYYTPYSTPKSYEDSLKELEQWSQQKKAESEKAYQEAVEKSRQQTQSKYQEGVKKLYEDLEQWKKENGF